MHSNNECLAIVMVDHVSNRFLKKLRIYHFSLSSSTFLTASWLPIFVSAEPSQTILLTAGLSIFCTRVISHLCKVVFPKMAQVIYCPLLRSLGRLYNFVIL